MNLAIKLLLAFVFLFSQQVYAESLKPFNASSRVEIERTHQGHPMVLAFWSMDCVYCLDELGVLADFVKQHPKIKLILVNVDGQSSSLEINKVLKQLRLPLKYEAWQFSESDEDRLRYSVDKNWYGELPRTYYYDASHQVKAVSGSPNLTWLKNWASRF